MQSINALLIWIGGEGVMFLGCPFDRVMVTARPNVS